VRFASLGCALVACSLLVPTLVSAQVPAPAWARSVEVIDDGAQVFGQPNRGARRRGSLALGTRLAFEARVAGTGCAAGGFVRLAPSLFVCEGDLRFSEAPPAGIAQPPMRDGDLLPYAYGFIRGDGTPSYGSPSDYFAGAYGDTFGHGFGLRIVARRTVDGVSFIQLARGSWVVADAVGVARGSQLEGIAIREGEAIDFAFTRGRETRIYASARGGRVVRRAGRREVVHVRELVGQYAALTDGTFVRTADLNRVVVTAPPEGVTGDERWIDVSIAEQVLVAYEGTRAVFATLVSTGADRRGSQTPTGAFRIWAKLATSDMDDLERTDVESNYLIEGVPWVQYFSGGIALHAAFWHDDFGHRRSHGCVNLSPRDARFLYAFTRPNVPDGFSAYIPDADERPTIVRVRP